MERKQFVCLFGANHHRIADIWDTEKLGLRPGGVYQRRVQLFYGKGLVYEWDQAKHIPVYKGSCEIMHLQQHDYIPIRVRQYEIGHDSKVKYHHYMGSYGPIRNSSSVPGGNPFLRRSSFKNKIIVPESHSKAMKNSGKLTTIASSNGAYSRSCAY